MPANKKPMTAEDVLVACKRYALRKQLQERAERSPLYKMLVLDRPPRGRQKQHMRGMAALKHKRRFHK